MASSLQFTSSLLLIAAAVSLLISPATSQTCKTQTFPGNTSFANCIDLPTLNAFLHYTYDPSPPSNPNPTLSIAFIAPPASPNGWVSWALNPTGTGMIGAQALVAFRDTNGSLVVKTYNIVSRTISESPISYDVLSRRAVSSGGVTTIFATLALPSGGGAGQLNQVWQVGSSVRNGVPGQHAVSSENLSSTGTLRLETTAKEDGNRTAAAPVGGDGGGAAPTPVKRNGNDSGGSSMISAPVFGLYGVLVLLLVVLGF